MAKVENHSLRSTWAQETSNKITFNEVAFQNGIIYKGPIVSNQLNGISHILSKILQFQQCSGGMYSASMPYHKGNFVTILHKDTLGELELKTFQCIADIEDGLLNKPPYSNAVKTILNGIDSYSGGVFDATNWKRVDIGQNTIINPQEFTAENNSTQYITELCRIPEMTYTANDEPIKEINSNIWITTYLGDKSCAVNLKLNGRYIVNKDKTKYISPRDYFNMPVPNVSIGEVIFFDGVEYSNDYIPAQKIAYANALTNQTINTDNLYNGIITPYGFNVWVGYTTTNAGTKIWSIYLAFNEADKITMSGSSNIDLSIKNRTDKVNINIQNVIPVRPNGGATTNYEELMSLREYDFPATTAQEIMLHYSRGEVELRSARVINLDSLAESVYRILGRMQGVTSATLKEHTARHTRAYGGDAWETDGSIYAGSKPGELLEPGLPNVWGKWQGSCFEFSAYNSFLGAFYNSGGYGHGRGGGDQDNMLYLGFNATACSPIYKGIVPNAGWKTMTGSVWSDVTTKAISVSRYIKIF